MMGNVDDHLLIFPETLFNCMMQDLSIQKFDVRIIKKHLFPIDIQIYI